MAAWLWEALSALALRRPSLCESLCVQSFRTMCIRHITHLPSHVRRSYT